MVLTDKGSSKILEKLDQADSTSTDPAADVEKTLEDNETNETSVSGRKCGTTNYMLPELTLLNKCMKAATPIGPSAIEDALKVYSCLSRDKGWAERDNKALRQKWDKVGHLYLRLMDLGLTVKFKLQTSQLKTGEDELNAILKDARDIKKAIQAKSGVVVVQDANQILHWEGVYQSLTMEDDATPPADEHAGGNPNKKPGSIIDLTASEEDLSTTRKVAAKANVVVKQEIPDPGVMKDAVRPVQENPSGGGNTKVATKSHRQPSDGGGALKTMKAETILTTIADDLSPEAQEKRKISRANLIRESRDYDRKDRMVEERMQEMRLEIQSLKNENNDLHRDNMRHHEDAIEATTALNIFNGSSCLFTSTLNPPAVYTPTAPAFATDPSPYSVPLTRNRSVKPEGVAGPGPQTMYYRQHGKEAEDLEMQEE